MYLSRYSYVTHIASLGFGVIKMPFPNIYYHDVSRGLSSMMLSHCDDTQSVSQLLFLKHCTNGHVAI